MADSPDVLKEKKRPRIADYPSSMVQGEDREILTTSDRQGGSREDHGYSCEPTVSSIRKAAPPPLLHIKKRPIPTGWIRDKNSAPFVPPPSFFPPPPYAAQPKGVSNHPASAAPALKPRKPAIMKPTQRNHQRSQSSGASLSQPPNSFVNRLLSAPPLPQIPHLTNGRSSPHSTTGPLLPPPGMLYTSLQTYLLTLLPLLVAINSHLTAGPPNRPREGHRRGSSTSGKVF